MCVVEESTVGDSQTMELDSLSLPVLAEVANQAAENAERDMRSAVSNAVTAGRALLAAKVQCVHGQWLGWLGVNWGYSQQLASQYMQLANYQHASYLESASSIREALRLIAADKAASESSEGEPGDVDVPDNIESESDDADDSLPHVARSKANNEWYTPPAVIVMANEVMGGIDLDPASSDAANEFVKARRYFTAEDNGLVHAWTGRVWMNPPYAKGHVDKFVEKLTKHYRDGDISQAIVLVNNATDAGWFNLLAEQSAAICFTRGRIKFLNAEGEPENSPLQGQALLYFGDREVQFIGAFSRLGNCWRAP